MSGIKDVVIQVVDVKSNALAVTPDPCHLKLDEDVRFHNLTTANVVVDMSQVPGFDRVQVMTLPPSVEFVADGDCARERVGEWTYHVYLATSRKRLDGASPRVILDV